ncbi:hypothetical protein K437DRAFT_49012 [Tilletiaria anomala UBC 951]|uniref:Integral membrane protein n=1 Tax=Tilletiaria anomala (strain ATCC 24038 / CBS 436.72 / UBC 951) TaxID=1037660 RepID=A0A066V5K0_TILAU|nr:uncharacterized protein K437DRAFT_49012 [Tilletiaria anomala UBC 951]KDN36741.1 hypothetical protein K437DRAFT_49012 [Tilletiaria anomala UBC 951]
MLTSGVLSGLAEILAGRLAGAAPPTKKLPPGQVSEKRIAQQQPLRLLLAHLESVGLNERALKMFIYGFAISAPLGHVMTGALQRAFAGRTTTRDKVIQIITANLTVSMIGNLVYLSSMAYINGARRLDQVVLAVRTNFIRVMRLTWATSPVSIAIAQNFLPSEVWEPFFTFIRFILSTWINTIAKKKQMQLARQEAAKKGKGTNLIDGDLAKGATQGR